MGTQTKCLFCDMYMEYDAELDFWFCPKCDEHKVGRKRARKIQEDTLVWLEDTES